MQQVSTLKELENIIRENAHALVVVDYTATWCGPCKALGPKLDALALLHKDVVFVKVDVDENLEAAEKFQISAMPTLHFWKNMDFEEVVGPDLVKIKSIIMKHTC